MAYFWLEKEGREPVVIAKHSPYKLIKKDEQRSFNGDICFYRKFITSWGLIEYAVKFPTNIDLNTI